MNGSWIDFSINMMFAEVEYCIIAVEKNILFRCKECFYTSVCVCTYIYLILKRFRKKLCIHRHTHIHTHIKGMQMIK